MWLWNTETVLVRATDINEKTLITFIRLHGMDRIFDIRSTVSVHKADYLNGTVTTVSMST